MAETSDTRSDRSVHFTAEEINLVETWTDGSSKEVRLRKPLEPSKSFLNIEEFNQKKMDSTSENWGALGKGARGFYQAQNQEIEGFAEVEQLMGNRESFEANRASNLKNEKIVIWLSFSVNVVLITSLILAVVFSGSISIVASVLDSALDLFSAFIIIATSRAKNRVNRLKYPQGKERLEPVGVLIFSAVMGTASLVLIIQATQRLIDDPMLPPDVGWIATGFLIAGITIKFLLFLYCRQFRERSLTAKALAQDHRNDVVLNSVALCTAYIGARVYPPVDSVGAILISLWTMFNWSESCLEQVKYLTGRAASPEFLKKLTWVCYNHDPEIEGIDTVRAFHFGTRYLVEIDIVLPSDMPLKKAHDIGESLQKKVEILEEVERAFVHLDFETSHDPKSEHKMWGEDMDS